MLKFIIIFIAVSAIFTYGQTQVKIPWPSLADSPWPLLRGDAQATGRSEFIGPSTDNILWQKDMPLGIDMGPVIGYNDVLYMGEFAISPPSGNYFYAVNNNGQDLWTFPTISFRANNVPPVVGKDSTIYFGSGNFSLFALHNSGELKWEMEKTVFGSTISISKNGDLYIPGVDSIWIIDPMGFVKNKVHTPDIMRTAISFSTGGDTIFYLTGAGFYPHPGALNAATLEGDLLWSFNFATNNQGAPLVDNQNKVYVLGTDSIASQNRYLNCIKPDGTLDWRYKIPGYRDKVAPTMDKNGNIIFHTILAYDSVWKNTIVSLDYYGNLNWFTPLDVGDWWQNYINHGLVCDAEGKIYCGSDAGGNFYCLNSSGKILWVIDMGDYEFSSSPAIGSNGTLYIGTHLSSLNTNHVKNLIAVKDKVNSVQNTNLSDLHYSLEQNFPNPFNPTTKIKFTIPASLRPPFNKGGKTGGLITLKVYDILGNEIATLVNEVKPAGSYEVEFSASGGGINLASGIYIYRLTAGKFSDSKKLILLK